MRNLIFILFACFALISCEQEDIEPRQLTYTDSVKYFVSSPAAYQSYCIYPFKYIILDGWVKDSTATYKWFPGGETSSSIEVDNQGDYRLSIFTESYTRVIDITIYNCEPSVIAPSSFSPEGDGVNDCWKPVFIGTLGYSPVDR